VEVLAAKTAANKRPAYIKSLGRQLRQFARGRESLPLAEVTAETVSQWCDAENMAPSSRRARMKFVSVLLSWAVKRGHLRQNPCTELERVVVDRRPPQILTPAQARKILLFAKLTMRWRLPQIVLGLYAGIRPTELERLYWRDIDLERGHVRIDAAAAKTRRRRIVTLDPKAIAWLRICKPQNFRPIGSNSRRWKKMIRMHCGVPLPSDVLRHTAASYLLAKHGDVGKVARLLGNSCDVLMTHFFELVTPADSRRFWRIFTPAGARTPIELPRVLRAPAAPLPGSHLAARCEFQPVEEAIKTHPGLTCRAIGELTGVSRRHAGRVAWLMENGDPAVLGSLRRGEISVEGTYLTLVWRKREARASEVEGNSCPQPTTSTAA
jgi:integrase